MGVPHSSPEFDIFGPLPWDNGVRGSLNGTHGPWTVGYKDVDQERDGQTSRATVNVSYTVRS